MTDPNRATNADMIAPNSAHGRYEFDKQSAQPQRQADLDTFYVSVRTEVSGTNWFSMKVFKDAFIESSSRVAEELDRLSAGYLESGQFPEDAVSFKDKYGTHVWLKLVKPEHMPNAEHPAYHNRIWE